MDARANSAKLTKLTYSPHVGRLCRVFWRPRVRARVGSLHLLRFALVLTCAMHAQLAANFGNFRMDSLVIASGAAARQSSCAAGLLRYVRTDGRGARA